MKELEKRSDSNKVKKVFEFAGRKIKLVVPVIAVLTLSSCSGPNVQNTVSETPPISFPLDLSELSSNSLDGENRIVEISPASSSPTLAPAPFQSSYSNLGISNAATEVPAISSSPEPLPKMLNETHKPVADETAIILDKDGIPVSYLSSEGERIPFDKEKILELRQQAISSGESMVIDTFSLRDYPGYEKTQKYCLYSGEHPETSELPGDVLSTNELAERGINIIQSDNTSLYIRKGAFEKGGPLEDSKDNSKKLTIFLLNGESIDKMFVDQDKITDSELKKFISYFPDELESRIDAEKAKFLSSLDDQKEEICQKVKYSSDPFYTNDPKFWDTRVLVLKAEKLMYQALSDRDWARVIDEMDQSPKGAIIFEDEPKKMTYVMPPQAQRKIVYGLFGYKPDNGNDPDRKFIAVAVGDTLKMDQRIIGFDSNGKFISFDYKRRGYSSKSNPNPKQAYPIPPEPINTDSDPNKYAYSLGNAPGFALRHEIAHYKLKALSLGGNSSERDADLLAVSQLKEASDKWRKSAYTDNSGYCFVFSLSKGNGEGYILTESLKGSPINNPKI